MQGISDALKVKQQGLQNVAAEQKIGAFDAEQGRADTRLDLQERTVDVNEQNAKAQFIKGQADAIRNAGIEDQNQSRRTALILQQMPLEEAYGAGLVDDEDYAAMAAKSPEQRKNWVDGTLVAHDSVANVKRKSFAPIQDKDGKLFIPVVNESAGTVEKIYLGEGAKLTPKAASNLKIEEAREIAQVKSDVDIAGAGPKTTAVKTAEKEVAREFAAPEAYNTMQFGLRSIEDIKKKVQGLKSHPGRESATGGSSIIPSRPGGDAAGFESNLLALQAETALASLIEAKANGATFGALSDAELDLLKAKLASLDLRQPEGQFIDNLNEITSMMDRKSADIQAAFKNQYGDYKPESTAQTAQDARPTQIAGDEAYGLLPSGAKFIDPNGQVRIKP